MPVDKSDLEPSPATGWDFRIRHMVLSWFGCGLSPKAPGTVASLGAIPLGAAIHWAFGPVSLVVCALVLFFAGWGVTAAHLNGQSHDADPQWIVIDEVVGQWLALAAVPFTPAGYALAFVLFRLFDIVKPWPVSWADQKIGGALGIMLDDFLAGLYAAVVASLILKAAAAL
jgi:phosphatidylglycerophosphatase A